MYGEEADLFFETYVLQYKTFDTLCFSYPFLPSLWQNRADIGLADGIFLSVTNSLIPPTSLRLHLVGLYPGALAEWGLAEPFPGRGAE